MAPIDYSKWDNIDTDSEPDVLSPQPPSPKANQASKTTTQVTQDLQSSTSTPMASQQTQNSSDPAQVQAVIVRCDMDKVRTPPWSATTIPANHRVFSQPVTPLSEVIGIPLVIHRDGTQSAYRPDLDNQIITYLNIDLAYGLAPAEWQSHIGTVTVARKDKKPFLPHHLEGVWMYASYILDLFGERGTAPTSLYNRQAFEKWWGNYYREQKEFRPGHGGELDPDDWRVVKSPYEI
ncbi:hypothetical protein B0J18DRAFT_417460 [Chaetomium sp. MPI-SDFR-AT-0129]|nr:hypothetical protein B0J18DRAFT_417460 [Chaetomium sp. MPI-SDFR-AT-0129]